jgi:cell wall assembly regulator SMI1
MREDAMTTENLRLDWREVEEVLRRVAPELVRQLADPAQEREIQEFEDAIGLRLPDDVRQAYLWHNGCRTSNTPGWHSFFVPSYRWGSLSETLSSWHMLCEVYEDYKDNEYANPPEDETWSERAVCPGCWRPQWIPIGLTNTSGRLYIDMTPCPKGTVGQLIQHSPEEEGEVLARSLNHYMHALLQAIADERVIYSAYKGRWLDVKSGEQLHVWKGGPSLPLLP